MRPDSADICPLPQAPARRNLDAESDQNEKTEKVKGYKINATQLYCLRPRGTGLPFQWGCIGKRRHRDGGARQPYLLRTTRHRPDFGAARGCKALVCC